IAEVLDHRLADLGIVVKPMHYLISGQHRGPQSPERVERGRLPGSDPARQPDERNTYSASPSGWSSASVFPPSEDGSAVAPDELAARAASSSDALPSSE